MATGLPATPPGPGTVDSAAVAALSDAVQDIVERVFGTVERTAAACTARLSAVASESRRPLSADLAVLRPDLHRRLVRDDLVSGLGFVAAPGLLSDTATCLEWWQTTGDGTVRPLLLDLDGVHSSFVDYTHWDWYARPRDTGGRLIAGPYVDYLCSEEYSLTFSLPVVVEGRFAGVAAADVYLRHFEATIAPLLRRLPVPARLVNARGRVAVSTDPHHLVGSLTKGLDFTAPPAQPSRPAVRGGLALFPCEGTSLALVTPAG
ncbi:cache domain-containing protein [Streptomyces sp. NPDC088812]|uniref:cache domain-containing protein n=1 Tax=Streptomyces sp. NPDC088812 TaxID=3365905 RepID=UPI0037F7B085